MAIVIRERGNHSPGFAEGKEKKTPA